MKELKEVQKQKISEFKNSIDILNSQLSNYIQGIADEKELNFEYQFDLQSMNFIKKEKENDKK